MKLPKCPNCDVAFTYGDGFKMWNAWTVNCPGCKAQLKMSRFVKAVVIFGGFILGGIPISLQEMGVWQTNDSLIYFSIAIPLWILTNLICWRITRFYIKDA